MEPDKTHDARPGLSRGLLLIIAYKFVLGPVLFALALWLTLSPATAYRSVGKLAAELTGAGHIGTLLAHWLQAQLSAGVLSEAAILAWLGGLAEVVEGFLLLRGGVWGEWMVVLSLAALLPFEVHALIRHPGIAKALVLAFNTLIVIYLVHRRLTLRGSAHPRG